MPNFYTGGSGSGGGGQSSFKLTPTFGKGGGGSSFTPPDNNQLDDPGKGSIDLGNVLGSIGQTFGNITGAVTGVVGGIGIPGGPNLGDVAELPGGLVDAVGGITLPYLGNDPNRTNAKVGDVPGLIGDVVSAPGRFVEGEVAKDRIKAQQEGRSSILADVLAGVGRESFGSQTDALRGLADDYRSQGKPIPLELSNLLAQMESANEVGTGLTPEFQARFDAGETVDTLAGDMVERGIGFSNDPGGNLAASVLLDPLNLIAPGVSKAIKGARGADVALRAGESLGVGSRFAGTVYGAASRGLSAGGAKLMDTMVGPTTSGVFHAIGSRPYFKIKSALNGIAPEYATAYDDAFAKGAAQLPRAVLASDMGREVGARVRTFAPGANVNETVETALTAVRGIPRNRLERDVEETLMRVTPDFAGHSDEGRFIETRDKLAQITGMSSEDAARALGGRADVKTAQHVHLAFYGRAGDDLAKAKAATATTSGFDPELVTIIAPDTLTEEIAEDIIAGRADLVSAVDNFSQLRNRFAGKDFEHSKVIEFVKKLRSEGALSKTTISPTTGRNKLPPAIKAWAREYEKYGYKVGFAPKDGMKAIIDDATGEVLHSDPFVHFVSAADPLTVRNPLGRFVDSLMRGSSQTTIVLDSRNRMVRLMGKSGLSANQTRAIHHDILETAAKSQVSPRGLAGMPGGTIEMLNEAGGQVTAHGNAFEEVFARHMTPKEYTAFRQTHDPTYIVMRSFEGNLSRVGLTQKFSGAVKSGAALLPGGNMLPTITDWLYPKMRFNLSPLFQAQEKIESPFLNALRGIRPHTVDQDVAKFYREMSELPDFKFLAEAGYTLNIAGGEAVKRVVGRDGRLGKALARFTDVKGGKEQQRIAQVLHEHGDDFKNAVESVSPQSWKAMTEAYGTTDPRLIAESFIKERQALASGNLDEAMGVFDDAASDFDTFYHGTARGSGAKIQAEGFDASKFGIRDRGPLAEPDYKGVYLTRDKQKATEYYATSASRPTNDVLGGGDVLRVKADATRFVPKAEWRDFKTKAKINLLDENGDLPGGINSQAVLDEQVRLAQEAGYAGVEMRAGEEILVFDPKDAIVGRSADTETVWQAFRESFRQTSQQAFKTHYFSPERGFLERTINHPYLGLYPASYMWGKVLPEFARFLLVRPFGLDAPLVGYAAMTRVQEAMAGAIATDPEFAKFLDDNKDSIYLINMLLPGDPTNLVSNLPAWYRHLAEDKIAGREVDPQTFISRESADAAKYAFGPARSIDVAARAGGDIMDIAGDLFANLTKSAEQYDQFVTR